jgi:hypothetical protein
VTAHRARGFYPEKRYADLVVEICGDAGLPGAKVDGNLVAVEISKPIGALKA